MDISWKEEYEKLASKFLKQHFGNAQGLTKNFPCMREDYNWGNHRPSVLDSRIPAKNNTEYHGLEKYALQYHETSQYDYAYNHWLLAAFWRRQDMEANNFSDNAHLNALEYSIKQALYNKALYEWQQEQKVKTTPVPCPETFGLKSDDIEKKDKTALEEIEKHINRDT